MVLLISWVIILNCEYALNIKTYLAFNDPFTLSIDLSKVSQKYTDNEKSLNTDTRPTVIFNQSPPIFRLFLPAPAYTAYTTVS